MEIQNLIRQNFNWVLSSGLKIALILIAAFLVNWFLNKLINNLVRDKIKGIVANDRKKRAETLASVLVGTSEFIIWIIAVLMILPEFGVSIAPILASLGILGLAVGMAARDILSDFISGLFILFEGQYYIGDTVKILGMEGEVQEITLRRTILKDKARLYYSIPNGQIKVVAKQE